MMKKNSILFISYDFSSLFSDNPKPSAMVDLDRMTIKKALITVTRQIEICGKRPRTISEYSIHVDHFAETTKLTYLDEIIAESIYQWLSGMEVRIKLSYHA